MTKIAVKLKELLNGNELLHDSFCSVIETIYNVHAAYIQNSWIKASGDIVISRFETWPARYVEAYVNKKGKLVVNKLNSKG